MSDNPDSGGAQLSPLENSPTQAQVVRPLQRTWHKGSKPMQQHQKITSNRKVGHLWQQVRNRVWHELDQKACPRCKLSINEHTRDTTVDLKKIGLGAALWPHQDEKVSPLGEGSAVVLMQKRNWEGTSA